MAVAQEVKEPQGQEKSVPQGQEATPGEREMKPQGHYNPMPVSPEKQARRTTARMDSLLGLTEKQRAKLYTLHLKEERRKAKAQSGSAAVPPGRDGRGPGGGPGFGGGNPPSGAPGMGAGNHGNPLPEGDFGQRPPRDFAPSADTIEAMEKQRAKEEKRRKKLEKKIRKILTEEQYARWQEERMRLPVEPHR